MAKGDDILDQVAEAAELGRAQQRGIHPGGGPHRRAPYERHRHNLSKENYGEMARDQSIAYSHYKVPSPPEVAESVTLNPAPSEIQTLPKPAAEIAKAESWVGRFLKEEKWAGKKGVAAAAALAIVGAASFALMRERDAKNQENVSERGR